MKKILIVGANGMIGNLILEKCLQRADVEQVISIARKSLKIKNDKFVEVIHDDFLNYSSIEHLFENVDIAFYCIGVYTGQVPTEEFIKITVDFTKVFADILKAKSPQAHFCFLSGAGADSTEKSNVLFAKHKGIAENYLLSLDFKQTNIFRPGYIYPVKKRIEPNIPYKIFRILYKPLSKIYPNIGVTSEKLADKMIEIAFSKCSQNIFENSEIRK